MRVLVLGGIAEAKIIADSLYANGIDITYSVAGMVRLPQMRCRVVSGGFSQSGGLNTFLSANNFSAVIDATHPYAAKISDTAQIAARECGIPCWRYQRPPWPSAVTDHCYGFQHWDGLAQQLRPYKHRFSTVGRLSQPMVDELTTAPGCQLLMRSAIEPTFVLPKNCHWLQAIGPFSLQDELKLMREFSIDVLISKNSGGQATLAKVIAARQLAIAVFLLDRPLLPPVDRQFSCPNACIDFVTTWAECSSAKTNVKKYPTALTRLPL